MVEAAVGGEVPDGGGEEEDEASALTPNNDSRAGVAPCPCWWRRLDIHLAEKVDDDDLGIVMDAVLDKPSRYEDILESIIGGASVGGDGKEGDRV